MAKRSIPCLSVASVREINMEPAERLDLESVPGQGIRITPTPATAEVIILTVSEFQNLWRSVATLSAIPRALTLSDFELEARILLILRRYGLIGEEAG